MAKLGSYFGLCPIIDQKSFLGINEDCVHENVLVTLGKNIVIKYKLSDQKQLQSWRTKDKFTSPVIYLRDQDKYCAVFSQMYLRMWNDEENLEKLKKYKFQKPIHTLVVCQNQSFIIFQNGHIAFLNTAFENRKEYSPEDIINEQNDKIIDVLTMSVKNNIFIGYIIATGESMKFIWTTFVEGNQTVYKKVSLDKAKLHLRGYTLAQVTGSEVSLLTIWSDGKLYTQPLESSTEETFFTIMESLSCKDTVTMIALNEDYVAMYGDNCNQEGASLIIYNTQFKVTQSQQAMKMYTSGTKLWCLHNKLFLCVGQNLAVVPYYLDSEQLAALVGSHKIAENVDPDISIVQDVLIGEWGQKGKKDVDDKSIPKKLRKDIQEYITLGMPEALICDKILPSYIENNNLESINFVLKTFKDIPEVYIAKLLNFFISASPDIFCPDSEKYSTPLKPMHRCTFIDSLLMIKYSHVIILPYLRKYLEYQNAILLLRYICYLLSEEGHSITSKKADENLIEWSTVVLDANYQKLVLSKDEKVVELLIYLNDLVKAYSCGLDQLSEIKSLLLSVKHKEFHKRRLQKNSYSIENLKLY